MKKKIILIGVVLLLIVVALIIPKERYESWFEKPNDDPVNYVDYQLLYVLNKEKQLVGIEVGLKETFTDETKDKWDLLTAKVDNLPVGYTSPIHQTTELLSYETENKVLKLNMSDDFLYSDGRSALECIVYNFCDDEIEEVELLINGDALTSFENLHFTRLSKKIGVNTIYETNKLFLSNDVTVIYHHDDYLLPVTYYYYDENVSEITYLVIKAMSLSEEVAGVDLTELVSYELNEETLDIHVQSFDNLDENVLQTIKASLDANFTINSIVVNGVSLTDSSSIEN